MELEPYYQDELFIKTKDYVDKNISDQIKKLVINYNNLSKYDQFIYYILIYFIVCLDYTITNNKLKNISNIELINLQILNIINQLSNTKKDYYDFKNIINDEIIDKLLKNDFPTIHMDYICVCKYLGSLIEEASKILLKKKIRVSDSFEYSLIKKFKDYLSSESSSDEDVSIDE